MSAPASERLGTAEEVRAAIEGAVRQLFVDENAKRARPAHAMSMSRLGGCTRAAAYAVAGTPVSDEPPAEEGRAAQLGTWEHEGLLPALAEQLSGARYEVPTVLRAVGLEVPGHIDLDWDDVVLDLKTVGERRLHGVRRAGPYLDHRVQVMGYALARMQSGRPVKWVVWLYLDRANGDMEVIVEQFTNAAAMAVIDRVQEIKRWSLTPDQARRDGNGPGLSLACDECHWLKRCYGPDAVPGRTGAQTSLARTDPQIEGLLQLYDAASARKSAATADQEFAKAALADARIGVYGAWSLRRGKGGNAVDQTAIKERFAELGEAVPTRATRGSLLVRLTEKLTKPMLAEIRAADVPETEPVDD